jgi:isoleucyl-tRNA synthetase
MSDRDKLTPMEIRKRARQCALEAVEQQKEQFRHWSVMGDWKNSYLTLDPAYEARQLRIFGQMVNKGRYLSLMASTSYNECDY